MHCAKRMSESKRGALLSHLHSFVLRNGCREPGPRDILPSFIIPYIRLDALRCYSLNIYFGKLRKRTLRNEACRMTTEIIFGVFSLQEIAQNLPLKMTVEQNIVHGIILRS